MRGEKRIRKQLEDYGQILNDTQNIVFHDTPNMRILWTPEYKGLGMSIDISLLDKLMALVDNECFVPPNVARSMQLAPEHVRTILRASFYPYGKIVIYKALSVAAKHALSKYPPPCIDGIEAVGAVAMAEVILNATWKDKQRLTYLGDSRYAFNKKQYLSLKRTFGTWLKQAVQILEKR